MASPPRFVAEVGNNNLISTMYYVYVLRSEKNSKKYVGFTEKHPTQRLKEHNQGSNGFTRQNRPFKLIYFEEHKEKAFALKRERFFKTGHGREYLKQVIPL